MLEKLVEIGLSDVEIRLYENLLVNGDKTILEISKLAKINRGYCYEALDKLLKKGFITKLIINNKIFWRAMPVEKINDYIDEIKSDLSNSIKKISKKIEKNNKIEFEFYTGKKGIKSICDEIAESKTKVIGFGAEGQIKKFFPYSYNHIFKKIKQNKVKFELLTLNNKIPIVKGMTKYKSFKKEFSSCVEINIFEDKTIIFFWKDNLEAIKIKDIDVANSFRNYHKEFWDIE